MSMNRRKFLPSPSLLRSLTEFAELLYSDPAWLEEQVYAEDNFDYLGRRVGIGQILPGHLYLRVRSTEPTSFMIGLTNDVWEAGFEIPSDINLNDLPPEELLIFQANEGRLKASKVRISFRDLISIDGAELFGPPPEGWPILLENIVYQSSATDNWRWNSFGSSGSAYYDVTEAFRQFIRMGASFNFPRGFPGLPLNR